MSNKSRAGCNCRNSRCCKMYCECFLVGTYCNANCNCKDCQNKEQGRTNKNKNKNKMKIKVNVNKPMINVHMGSVAVNSNRKGCQCRRSMCIKKYCECFQAGTYCGEHCGCRNCLNTVEMAMGMGNSAIINDIGKGSGSLYPIVVSQGPQQLQAILNNHSQSQQALKSLDAQARVGQLFAQPQPTPVLSNFINILKDIDNKLVVLPQPQGQSQGQSQIKIEQKEQKEQKGEEGGEEKREQKQQQQQQQQQQK